MEVENGVVGSNTLRLEDDRTLAFQTDGNGCQQEDGRKNNNSQSRENNVENTLPYRNLEFQHPVSWCRIVEHLSLAVGNERDLFVELCNRSIDINGVINAAPLIYLTIILGHVVGEQDDVNTLVPLFQIGNSRDVFRLLSLFIEHNEMLIANMSRAGGSRIFVILRILYQTTRNVSQTFFGLRITTKIYYT